MSLEDYKKKQSAIMSSSATMETRRQALENLEVQFRGVNRRNQQILKSIYESEAEIKGSEF